MIEWLTEWAQAHETMLWVLGILSLVIFIASLVLLPYVLIKLPPDYLSSPRTSSRSFKHGSMKDRIYLAGKNFLAVLMILGGVAMLVLPGQGVLTLVIGVSLLDFSAKRRIIKKLLSQQKVLGTANWVRRKADRPPLRSPT